MIADALGIEAIDPPVWDMVQGPLPGWLGDAGPIGRGDPAAVAGLFEGLALVGLAMERHGSSRPASGADHQIAHLWEMQDLRHRGERVSHGACVAVAGAAVLRLYDWLLAQPDLALDPDALASRAPSLARKDAAIRAALGEGEVAARALEETAAKHAEPGALRDRLRALASVWPELRLRLRDRLWTAERMAAALAAAGAPASPEEIGLSAADLRRAAGGALWLRSRYTLLDLLTETGLLSRALAEALPDPLRERTA
jgi:glycerol-1-phosphate dehydrogenase [NAD(P)+]